MMLRQVRRWLRLAPPYSSVRQKLYAAIDAGKLLETAPLEQNIRAIESLVGWDSRFDGADWVELVAWSEKLGLQLKTVGDFLRLLDSLDRIAAGEA